MNPICEQVRLSAMAHADGESETASLGLAEMESHVAGCAECRSALAEMEVATQLLADHRLRPQTVQLAARVHEGIAAAQSCREARRFSGLFVALLTILLAERAITLRSDAPTRWASRGAVCLLVAGWFICQRQNPFSLNEHLEFSRKITL
jgi:hypothetical protein